MHRKTIWNATDILISTAYICSKTDLDTIFSITCRETTLFIALAKFLVKDYQRLNQKKN